MIVIWIGHSEDTLLIKHSNASPALGLLVLIAQPIRHVLVLFAAAVRESTMVDLRTGFAVHRHWHEPNRVDGTPI